MKKTSKNLNSIGRYIASLSVGILIVGSGFLVYFALVFPSIIDSPWHIQLLVIETIALPLVTFSIYIMYRMFLANVAKKEPIKRLRQWAGVLILVYGYSLGLVFFSFLLEILTPSLPLFYKGIFLPLVINLILMLILTKTRLWARYERFIKRLFGESPSD